MASGRSHDRATGLLSLPFGLLWWPMQGPMGTAVAAAAFLIGGLWLSPDLDTRSKATRRWGPLRLLWWPYRHWLPHRSIVSHSPVLGTVGRLFYLGVLVILASLLLMPFGSPGPDWLINGLQENWLNRKPLVVVALVGLEMSSWLHLLQDGDPLPRFRFKPLQVSMRSQKRRRRRRQRRRPGIRPQPPAGTMRVRKRRR
jgi:uncharacterized metal-binding protein